MFSAFFFVVAKKSSTKERFAKNPNVATFGVMPLVNGEYELGS